MTVHIVLYWMACVMNVANKTDKRNVHMERHSVTEQNPALH